VIDPSPAGMNYITATAPGSLIFNTDGITWTGNISANESITITLQALAEADLAAGDIITNIATISDGMTPITKSAAVAIGAKVYFPIIFKRWPPIPYAPVLNAISNPSHGGDYTVSWESADLAITYTLQEDDNSGFSSPQDYDVGGALSKAFTGKPGGTYYYRVRGNNEWGPGDWSNIESTAVNFFDDFSNPSSGWPIVYNPLYTFSYINGEYQIYIPPDPGDTTTWYDIPAVLAPAQPPAGAPYCVSADVHFTSGPQRDQPGWSELYGLIFGTSADLRTIYRLQTNVFGDWAALKYTCYTMPYGGIRACDHDITVGDSRDGIATGFGLNHFMVQVNGTTAVFYINHSLKGWATGLNDLPALNRVGILGGAWEISPLYIRFDNFMWSTDINACPK
jgi:hypothetical protein